MLSYLTAQFRALRPAFSRQAAFFWFLVVFAGFVLRADLYGVSSIIRALDLSPAYYPCLLHFFHSSAWTAERLYQTWWIWLLAQKIPVRVSGRLVVLGDHTKQPKDARRMPQVTTMHQDSETSSKPSFFRGHHWACLSLLGQSFSKRFSLPLWAEIHPEELPDSRAVRLVQVASQMAERMQTSVYLVLDAFFSVGSVFQVAAQSEGRLHILTRAKKNIVAYTLPPSNARQRGRPRLYGDKLRLLSLFDTQSGKFLSVEAEVYQRKEPVRYLVRDLIWKPTKGILRFFLIESSRGRLILISSDLSLSLQNALQLYTSRVTIECLFASLKNLLGGLAYHFWSKYLEPVSRRPVRKQGLLPVSSRPEKTRNTLEAIHKFLAVHIIVVGTLRLLAFHCTHDIRRQAHCWLRTPCGEAPSEFVTRTALANFLRVNIAVFVKQCSMPFIPRRLSDQPRFHVKTGKIFRREKFRNCKAA
jgi:hypothetical protein